MKESPLLIGFPTGLLGQQALRLQVLHSFPGGFVLEKPAGIQGDFHPWYVDQPVLVDVLRSQLKAQKPELLRLDIAVLRSIFFIEPEVTGAVLFATREGSCDFLRNAFGSGQLTLSFRFIALTNSDLVDNFEIDLPIGVDEKTQQSKISHRFGKQSATRFRLINRANGYDEWEACVNYCRMHQVRLHAHEAGLRILGESLYDQVAIPTLSQLKRKVLKPQSLSPLYESLLLHLSSIQLPVDGAGDKLAIDVPFPKKWLVFLKHIFSK